jgi:hypothetical protein
VTNRDELEQKILVLLREQDIVPAGELHRTVSPGMNYVQFKRVLFRMAGSGKIDIYDFQKRHFVGRPAVTA